MSPSTWWAFASGVVNVSDHVYVSVDVDDDGVQLHLVVAISIHLYVSLGEVWLELDFVDVAHAYAYIEIVDVRPVVVD